MLETEISKLLYSWLFYFESMNPWPTGLKRVIDMADEPNVPGTENTATEPEKTFTQAEVNEIVSQRLERQKKKFPTDEELSAFRTWKESQQTEKERWDSLAAERDTARTELAAANAELEQYRRERFLMSKGVSAEDVDYIAFKVGKLVNDTMDFETAAAAWLKEHAPKEPDPAAGRIRVEMAAPLGGGNPPKASINDRINNMLRGG